MDAYGDSEVQPSEASVGNKFDSRMYKTSLCNYYLQGICKNGDKCPFAHGTLDLRVAGMSEPLKSTSNDKRKTLCVKFVANGICPLGVNCEYAHSVNEVKAAMEADKFVSHQASHPLYKTSLCHNYMTGMYCEFADRCQYAHGHHELRQIKVDKLPTDIKQRRFEQLRQMPGYKTRLCPAFEQTGTCQHQDLCFFAHSIAEICANSLSASPKPNSVRKTVMCKNLSNCKFGPTCNFAHHPSELAQNAPVMSSCTTPCRNILQQGFCSRGASCKFDHNIMCLQTHNGFNNSSPKQVAMCPSMLDIGYCVRGKANCNFSHSDDEIPNPWLDTNGPDQKFKSIICKNWQFGSCKFGTNCRFAHGNHELRVTEAPNLAVAAFRQHGEPDFSQSNKFKVVLCNFFTQKGYCKNGSNCSFAHGVSELRVPYKTTLCKNYSANKQCPQGECCVFAHGQEELKTSESNSHSNMSKVAESSGTEARVIKRRRCINFSAFGKCPVVNCEFLHGPDQEDNERSEEGLEKKRPRQI